MLHTTPMMDHIGLSNIAEATKSDPSLSKIVNLIKSVKIAISKSEAGEVLRLKTIFSELTTTGNNIILKGDRIVLPKQLQPQAIQLAHKGAHPGQSGLLRRLRNHFFFHGMDKEVQIYVQSCHECSLFTDKKTQDLSDHTTSQTNAGKRYL